MGLIRIKKIDDIQLWVYFGLIDLCATKIKYASNGRVRRHASRFSIGRPESFSYAVLGFSDKSEVACTITTCNLPAGIIDLLVCPPSDGGRIW